MSRDDSGDVLRSRHAVLTKVPASQPASEGVDAVPASDGVDAVGMGSDADAAAAPRVSDVLRSRQTE